MDSITGEDGVFWELRMSLYDSHVDNKHLGFYRTKEALGEAAKAEVNSEAGSTYVVAHQFED